MTNQEIKKMSKQLYKSYEKLISTKVMDLEDPNSSDQFMKATLSLGNAAALLKQITEKK
jgi:hypothetical protein